MERTHSSILLRFVLTLCLLLILALPTPAEEEEASGDDLWNLSLEELLNTKVTTASKKEQSISDAPAILTVISAQQIEELGVQNLSQLMAYVPGFVVEDTYWKKDIITARGVRMTLYNDKILMLINGVPAYDAAALEHYLDTVPMNAIKQIEIIRGPGSTLYGTNAFSAVINIITKSSEDLDGVSTFARIGSFDTSDLGVSVGDKAGDFNYFFSGRFRNDDGYNKTPRDETGTRGPVNYEKDFSTLYAALGYKDLTVQAGYAYQRWGKFGPVPVHRFSNMGHDELGIAHEQKLYVNAIFERSLSDRFSAKLTGHFDWMDKQSSFGAFGYDVFQNALGVIDTTVPPDYATFGGRVFLAEAQGEYELNENWRLVGGAVGETRIVDGLSTVLSDLDGDVLFEGSTEELPFSTNDFGAYLQADGRFLEKFGLVAGIRGNYLGVNENFYVTPRAGLVYNPKEMTSIKLLYGEAFRSPGPQEQYYQVPGIVYGPDILDQQLEPERIRTMEIALDQTLLEKHNLRINGFYTQVFDIIGRRAPLPSESPTVGNALVYDNLGDQSVQGVEAELRGYPSRKLNYFINLSYQVGTDDETDEDLLYNPTVTSSGGLTWQPTPDWQITPSYVYVGEKDGLQNGAPPVDFTVDAYVLMNLRIAYAVNDQLQLSVQSLNVLDTQYKYPESVRHNLKTIPGGPGRTIFFSVHYRTN